MLLSSGALGNRLPGSKYTARVRRAKSKAKMLVVCCVKVSDAEAADAPGDGIERDVVIVSGDDPG